MGTFKTTQFTLAADLATTGTVAVTYPTGMTRGDFVRGVRHHLLVANSSFVSPTDFTVALGATQATITYNGPSTLKAGSLATFQLDMGGADTYRSDRAPVPSIRDAKVDLYLVELGAPVAGAANAVSLTQAVGVGGSALLNGAAMTSAPLLTLDVPRNVVGAWTGTAVVTVTGRDVFGAVVVESSASGTTLTGKKAFSSITSVVSSAAITAATVGTGNVLGLPVHLPNGVHVLKEVEDLAAATAGTVVAGLAQGTKSTAVTADVRGTYTPNSTPDGSKAFALMLAVPDIHNKGNPQFAG